MAFYSVMVPPPGSGGARAEIEQARLLRESFIWPAFLFTGLWLLGKRLWLASLVFVVLMAALVYAERRFGFADGAFMLAYGSIALFLGFEGQNLIARKLARQGWRLADVVEARDLAEAERRFFERALAGEAAPPRASPPPARPQALSAPLPVIGLFPEARGR